MLKNKLIKNEVINHIFVNSKWVLLKLLSTAVTGSYYLYIEISYQIRYTDSTVIQI